LCDYADFLTPYEGRTFNMAAFFEYLRNITYYLMFMAVVGLIAPSGNYKKYIAVVMGIMLIGVVINPITAGLGQSSLPMTEIFGNILPAPTASQSDHFFWQQEQIQAAFHAQLTAQVDALLARNGYQLISADWETSEDFTTIRNIRLQARVVETAPTPVPFIRIKPIRVAPYQPMEEPEEAREIKNLISDFYDLSVDNIYVEILER